jgi:hypothetical protein
MSVARWLACALVIVAAAALLIVPSVTAQPTSTEQYVSRACGLSFQHPTGWRRSTDQQGQRGQLRILVESPEDPTTSTQIIIGPVLDELPAQLTTENLALGMAAQNCLDCLRQSLVWVDRFMAGTSAVSYTISLRDVRINNQLHPHYALEYFMFNDGSARGLIEPGARTRAEVRAWVPAARLRTAEPVVSGVVRSLQLMRPEGRPCWST